MELRINRVRINRAQPVYRREWLVCYAGHQEVSRCYIRVNPRECLHTCMPLPSANKGTHSGFGTQRRYHQKSKTRFSKKKIFLKRKKEFVCTMTSYFNRLIRSFVNDTGKINLQFLFSNPSSSIVCHASLENRRVCRLLT